VPGPSGSDRPPWWQRDFHLSKLKPLEQPTFIDNPRDPIRYSHFHPRVKNKKIGLDRDRHPQIANLRVSRDKAVAPDILLQLSQQKSRRHECATLLQKLHGDNFQFPAGQQWADPGEPKPSFGILQQHWTFNNRV
jgi:hypothetical protein